MTKNDLLIHMTNIRKLLAANIKIFRKELGLTQSRLAERANTATRYIAMIEGGKNFPSPEMMERLAVALEKDTIDLFAIPPIQNEWKKSILADIVKLITEKLNEFRKDSEIPNRGISQLF